MADLPGKHAMARRLIRSCEEGLAKMERMQNTIALQDTERRLTDLKVVVRDMEGILGSAFSMPLKQRNEWKGKVNSSVTAAAQIDVSLRKLKGNLSRKECEDAERDALLNGASAAFATVDRDARALGHARQARRAVEEMLDTAAGVLTNMGATRERLKRTQRKLLDVANSLGISDRILSLADRRHKGDAYIVYGGMAVVSLIVVVLLFWVR